MQLKLLKFDNVYKEKIADYYMLGIMEDYTLSLSLMTFSGALLVKPVRAGDTHGGLPPCAYSHHCIPLVKQEGSIQLCYISPRQSRDSAGMTLFGEAAHQALACGASWPIYGNASCILICNPIVIPPDSVDQYLKDITTQLHIMLSYTQYSKSDSLNQHPFQRNFPSSL